MCLCRISALRTLFRPVLLFGLLLAGLLAVATCPAGTLRSERGAFVDVGNGTAVLRDFDLSQHHKFPPFRPDTDPALFERLVASGINVVREMPLQMPGAGSFIAMHMQLVTRQSLGLR